KIDMDLLEEVDNQILKDIGMSAAGDRLRVRKAIAKLAPAPVAEANLSVTAPTPETPAAAAERRQLTVMFCDLGGSTALSARIMQTTAATPALGANLLVVMPGAQSSGGARLEAAKARNRDRGVETPVGWPPRPNHPRCPDRNRHRHLKDGSWMCRETAQA